MLLEENRLSNIALVKPDAAVQVAETVGLKPIGHAEGGEPLQSGKTTGPVAAVATFESKWMWTPVRLLVRPVATTVMEKDVCVSCLNVTVADPAGDPTEGSGFSCATVATNCRSSEHTDSDEDGGSLYSSRATWYDITALAASNPPWATAVKTARVPVVW